MNPPASLYELNYSMERRAQLATAQATAYLDEKLPLIERRVQLATVEAKAYVDGQLPRIGYMLERRAQLAVAEAIAYVDQRLGPTNFDPVSAPLDAEVARISRSALFDKRYYEAGARTYFETVDDAVKHYLHVGSALGLPPNPLFDPIWYRQHYTDVHDAQLEPLLHYIDHGAQEGRAPSSRFDPVHYRRNHTNSDQIGADPLAHFIRSEAAAGRDFVLAAISKLDSDYGTLTPSFALWRRLTAEAWIPEHATTAVTSAGKLMLVVSKRGRCQDRARQSFIAAADLLGIPGSVVKFEELVANPQIAEDNGAFVIFADEGDYFDPLGLQAFAFLKRPEHDVLVFDFFYSAARRSYPVFFPGPNEVFIRAIHPTLLRFAIRSHVLRRLLALSLNQPANVLLASFDHFGSNLGRRLGHVAFPVLEADDCATPPAPDLIREPSAENCRATQYDKVTVVICTRDKGVLLRQLIDSLITNQMEHLEAIVVVSNQTSNFIAQSTLRQIALEPLVTVIDYPLNFNFSIQSNLGARNATGKFLLFLNDDIIPVSSHWLSDLKRPFDDPTVAAVGPLLLYPDERVQHAGMFLGYHNVAGHTLRGARLPDGDYMFTATTPRQVSSLTGAALLVRRTMFEDINGFDSQLATYLQDVDLCLRLRNSGFRLVYQPRSLLFHMESVSICHLLETSEVGSQRVREFRHFTLKWGRTVVDDPFSNPNFSTTDESLRTLTKRFQEGGDPRG